jgi:hypothetical protein
MSPVLVKKTLIQKLIIINVFCLFLMRHKNSSNLRAPNQPNFKISILILDLSRVSWGAANFADHQQGSPSEKQSLQASDDKKELAPKTANNPGKEPFLEIFCQVFLI